MRLTPRTKGFSYAEVLIAAVLVAVAIAPATETISQAIDRAALGEEAVLMRFHRRTLMETLLAEQYGDLLVAAEAAGNETTPTSYSDPFSPQQRFAYIARYDADADPFTVPDPDTDGDGNPFTGYTGLLWIKVTQADAVETLETLIAP